MHHSLRIRWLAPAVMLAAAPLIAAITPADQVRTRVANYKQLGAAYKAVNDGVRAGRPPSAIAPAAAQIAAAARAQYRLFPAGSGPQPGVKTAAKREIWTNARGFRAAQDAFARQAATFQRAVAGGNADLTRAESRKLGATCKGCHDQFREQSD